MFDKVKGTHKPEQISELYKCHLTLIRGAKGEYRWEISVKDDNDGTALVRIIEVDKKLKESFEVK